MVLLAPSVFLLAAVCGLIGPALAKKARYACTNYLNYCSVDWQPAADCRGGAVGLGRALHYDALLERKPDPRRHNAVEDGVPVGI